MQIIFGQVTYWQTFIMIILKYLKFDVYYIWIDEKSDIKKNKIATKLKKNNIIPLPIEFQNTISHKASVSLVNSDPDERAYKRNIELAPDPILKKYCNLFLVNKNETKKLDCYYKILYLFIKFIYRPPLVFGQLYILKKN